MFHGSRPVCLLPMTETRCEPKNKANSLQTHHSHTLRLLSSDVVTNFRFSSTNVMVLTAPRCLSYSCVTSPDSTSHLTERDTQSRHKGNSSVHIHHTCIAPSHSLHSFLSDPFCPHSFLLLNLFASISLVSSPNLLWRAYCTILKAIHTVGGLGSGTETSIHCIRIHVL